MIIVPRRHVQLSRAMKVRVSEKHGTEENINRFNQETLHWSAFLLAH
jgi:hypothetical protein